MNTGILASLGMFACTGGICAGATVYGLTATNLVRFETSNPASITVIGPHGLGTGGTTVAYLAYHPAQDKFFGLHYSVPGANGYELRLFSIDPATGAGTLVANLGFTGVNQTFYEALEYVDSLGTLVIGHGPNGIASDLLTITPTGVTAPLTTNGRDNDYSAYDHTRNIFYTFDTNGFGQLETVNLGTGATAPQGGIAGLVGDMAYDAGDDRIYGYTYSNNHLFRVTTTNGVAPISVSDLGLVGGDALRGVAVIPSPCPGDINGDGNTNIADFNILAGNFGDGPGATLAQGDLSGDGFVNIADFNILAGDFGCAG